MKTKSSQVRSQHGQSLKNWMRFIDRSWQLKRFTISIKSLFSVTLTRQIMMSRYFSPTCPWWAAPRTSLSASALTRHPCSPSGPWWTCPSWCLERSNRPGNRFKLSKGVLVITFIQLLGQFKANSSETFPCVLSLFHLKLHGFLKKINCVVTL